MKPRIRLLFLSVLCLGLCGFSAENSPLRTEHSTDLSFEQRVFYQRAIEEVYWNHTIWPESNPQLKPPLSKVISEKDVRSKVDEYLRKSKALSSYFHQRIRAEQLQAEIDRMANETKDSELLRELWGVLGNDPYLVAETLARPIVVDRLTQQLPDFDPWWNRNRGSFQGPVELPLHQYSLPEIKNSTFNFAAISTDATSNTWTATTITGVPTARCCQTAIWTGTQMIVWGGFNANVYFKTGGRYTPSTNSWSATTTTGAPAGRELHTAVWTGTEMIIWGGGNGGAYFADGGRYNPSTNSWSLITITNAPTARWYHTAVWTGTRMIVWGGLGTLGYFKTGGRYNPSTDSWAKTTITGAPSARFAHTAVWTGSQMIIWGGGDDVGEFNTGGRYTPSSNSWTATTTAGAPSARGYHTAVWTGTQMIIWGGYNNGAVFNTGGRYSPASNSWTATTTSGAPTARNIHTAVWTGIEMIIWGGENAAGSTFYRSGGRYTPSTNSWIATTTTGAPAARSLHTAIWTGTEMIIWGGYHSTGYVKTGGRYTP
jgi:N-acetylneuraminic acid mutarotase